MELLQPNTKMYSRVVYPWISYEEWSFVKESLFHEDANVVRKAVDIIAAWKARCPDIPVELMLIKSLISLNLSRPIHNATDEEKEAFSEKCALTLIRFVNLVTEPFLEKSRSLTYTASNTLNIPEWIIDIRHNATHKKLPGHEILLGGITVAIEWLKTNFFDQIPPDFASRGLQSTKTKLESILIDYVIHRVALIKTKKEKRKLLTNECLKYINALTTCLNNEINSYEIFFEILVTENYLIPTPSQLKALGYINEDIVEYFKDELPTKMGILWTPVFQMMKEIGCLHHFVKFLLSLLTMNDDLPQMVVVCWLRWICSNYGCNSLYSSSVNVKEVVIEAAQRPTPCVIKLIDALLNAIPEVRDDLSLRRWLHSFADSNQNLWNYDDTGEDDDNDDMDGSESNDFSTDNSEISASKSDVDLLLSYDILSLNSAKEKPRCVNYGIWSTCPDEKEIMDCPIGLLPGQDPTCILKFAPFSVDGFRRTEGGTGFRDERRSSVLLSQKALIDNSLKEEIKANIRIL